MRSALDSAVHDHIDFVTYGIHDLGQLIKRRARSVKLAATVIGQNDTRAANIDRTPRIRHRHDALQAELS